MRSSCTRSTRSNARLVGCFFWGSDLYKKTGEFRYALGGNSPFIVNRHTGAVVETGTAFPTEVYVQRYEASLA